MKKIILLFLIVIWMFIIFMFSNEPAVESTNSSGGIIDVVIDFYEKISSKNLSVEKKQLLSEKLQFPIRKSAHLTIYLILGIIVYLLFLELNYSEKYLLSILICLIYAISDEIHQMFVVGRSGEIRDVLIDIFGSFIGIFIIKRLKELKK